MQFMKKLFTFTTFAILVLAYTTFLNAGAMKGKAEEYHHALNLCFQHTADHAKALFDQVSNGELNVEIAKDFLDQIGSDLDHARVYHAMVHKTYSEADIKTITDDHLIILGGQTAAVTALATLKAEMEKAKPDITTIKNLSAVIFNGATKAVNAHVDAMKKLGIPEAKGPSA
jgi:polyhydroxyalkanoate synthesis regulator phasin